MLQDKTIAIKDNIVTWKSQSTAASRILSNHSSPFDATVVKLLRENGAVISAKTNLDEFGMGSHSQNSHYGAVLSPYSRNGIPLSPGGSSGGSAVAVAMGECWAALGTDTGGSVRLPAAYTGVFGFKPSYGVLSRWGVIPYANSLDTVGILSQSSHAAQLLFNLLNQHDPQDPTSLAPTVRARLGSHRASGRPLRIGIPTDYNIHELSQPVRRTYAPLLSTLSAANHTLIPISLPTTRLALSAYYVLAPAEASSNLAKYDGVRYGHRTSGPDALPREKLPLYARTRGEGFGDEVQRRILLGAYTLSSEAMDNYFIQAQKVRRLVQADFDAVFQLRNPLLEGAVGMDGGVDVLVTPTAPTLPPTVEEVARQTAVEGYMNDVFTVPASLAGLPAASVPVALSEEVRDGIEESDVRSVGVQVVGQFGDDETVFEVAKMIEESQ